MFRACPPPAITTAGGGSVQERTERAQEMTNYYYDLATDFYEYGWCVRQSQATPWVPTHTHSSAPPPPPPH